MKQILFLFLIVSEFITLGQSTFCPRYIFEGEIKAKSDLKINMSFTVLLDSTLVGSYFYKPNQGSLKIVGHLNVDNSFILCERDKRDSITGIFKGVMNKDNSEATGKWNSPKNNSLYDFKLYKSVSESFWDYIKKNRSFYKYKSIDLAIINYQTVKSIDLEDYGIDTLPENISILTQIESINLLGNKFTSFPEVLTELISLDEISVCSNNLKTLPPSIGKLKNLRILIANFNDLEAIPKEIGQLENLLYLELGSNNLKSLPSEIKNLNKLQELHLSGNNFSEKEKARIKKLLPKTVIFF